MIITLTTDFGLADPFVGIMKGVILGIAPHARLVDITHDIRAYDVLDAAFTIHGAFRYFPEGTVHVVVVDPGVGSVRRPLAAAAKGHMFVAPDNGVLSWVLHAEPPAPTPATYWISNRSLFLESVSRTFHGRDIFAPVAARLAEGAPIESVGPRIVDVVTHPFPRLRREGDRLVGAVLHIDRFGNIVTNLRPHDLGTGEFTIHVAGRRITRLCSTFSDGEAGELVAVEGSTGFIEIALNRGSAAGRAAVERGAEIELEISSGRQ